MLAQGAAGAARRASSAGRDAGRVRRRSSLVTGANWLRFDASNGARDSTLMLRLLQEDLRVLGSTRLSRAGNPADGLSPPTQVPFGESRAIRRAGGRCLTVIGSNDLFYWREDRFPEAVDVAAIGRVATAAGRIAVALTS